MIPYNIVITLLLKRLFGFVHSHPRNLLFTTREPKNSSVAFTGTAKCRMSCEGGWRRAKSKWGYYLNWLPGLKGLPEDIHCAHQPAAVKRDTHAPIRCLVLWQANCKLAQHPTTTDQRKEEDSGDEVEVKVCLVKANLIVSGNPIQWHGNGRFFHWIFHTHYDWMERQRQSWGTERDVSPKWNFSNDKWDFWTQHNFSTFPVTAPFVGGPG